MDNTSYLFMSRRKRLKFSYRIMDKDSSTDSNISLDSLENSMKWKAKIKSKPSEDKVDTILVPFYENDVLIKVPKNQKRNTNNAGKSYKSEKAKKESNQPTSYLIKKDKQKVQRPTYLEMFRKQLGPNDTNKKCDKNEIRSLSPEFGDTERESIEDDLNNAVTEFYNTEAYNEMYYEKLLNRDVQIYMENSLEESLILQENLNIEALSTRDESPDNFRSVSEVSNVRRAPRRATIDQPPNVKLGGLGPDVEKIRPRLERARSLQRYSEKVRMENRLRIYKNTLQASNEKKVEKVSCAKQRHSGKESIEAQVKPTASYLINKTTNDKQAKVKNVYSKSKSADAQKTRARNAESERAKQRPVSKRTEKETEKNRPDKVETARRHSAKANPNISSGNSASINKCISTDDGDSGPVQISFIVNVGGVRPSSALKTLEQKHRMYQEQVKEFMDNNNG